MGQPADMSHERSFLCVFCVLCVFLLDEAAAPREGGAARRCSAGRASDDRGFSGLRSGLVSRSGASQRRFRSGSENGIRRAAPSVFPSAPAIVHSPPLASPDSRGG